MWEGMPTQRLEEESAGARREGGRERVRERKRVREKEREREREHMHVGERVLRKRFGSSFYMFFPPPGPALCKLGLASSAVCSVCSA